MSLTLDSSPVAQSPTLPLPRWISLKRTRLQDVQEVFEKQEVDDVLLQRQGGRSCASSYGHLQDHILEFCSSICQLRSIHVSKKALVITLVEQLAEGFPSSFIRLQLMKRWVLFKPKVFWRPPKLPHHLSNQLQRSEKHLKSRPLSVDFGASFHQCMRNSKLQPTKKGLLRTLQQSS